MTKTIGNPISWTAKIFGQGSHYIGDGVSELRAKDTAPVEVRPLSMSDLGIALHKGWDDFLAMRTDVIYLVVLYPILGFLLTWFVMNQDMLPLLVPLVTGFALLGPVAALGLYELSRRRENGLETNWSNALAVLGSPSFIPVVALGFYLLAIFMVWMLAAHFLYSVTVGPESPTSLMTLMTDVFTTSAGWTMLIVGVGIGFLFALLVLAISLISFPLLLDRHVGLPTAVLTSMRIARENPVAVLAWGAMIVGLLAIGMVTLFIGLVVILPVLGHATWHLYRLAVVRHDDPAPVMVDIPA